MASQLTSIVAAVAALSVTVPSSVAYNGDKTPQALYLDTLPNGAPDAKLPARLIRMLRATDPAAQAFTVIFGNDNTARVNWRVYDVLLWRKLAQGLGVGSHEADLVKYAQKYADALQTLPATLGALRAQITGVTMAIAEINFPLGSDFWFAGVEIALDIEERLISANPANWS